MTPTESEILTVPEGMSARQFVELDRALKAWEKQVRENAAVFPARGYALGQAQIQAFMQLLGRTGITTLPPGTSSMIGSTKRAAVEWVTDRDVLLDSDRYHAINRLASDLNHAIGRQVDELRTMLSEALREGENPTTVASRFFKATRDATTNWRMVARTQMVRANAEGRYAAIRAMGITKVWFPRHAGACADCRRLLEDQVFDIDQVEQVTNTGRNREDWVSCAPLHPHCRHVPLPWMPDVYEAAQAEYRALDGAGLDDKALNEMFDASGHVNPGFEADPRLRSLFELAGKSVDPLQFALGQAIAKACGRGVDVRKAIGVTETGLLGPANRPLGRKSLGAVRGTPERLEFIRGRQEPPGLHHTSGRRSCGNCEFYERPECARYSWQVDRDEVCSSWARKQISTPATVGKGFFDNPQQGLDPLIWTPDEQLRDDVRDRVVRWRCRTLGKDAPLWSRLFITGSAASRAWAGKTAGDVDLQVVVDYDAMRRHQSSSQFLSELQLHDAVVSQLKAALKGFEVANGLPLDAFVRPQHTVPEFLASVRDSGQGAWDIQAGRWVVEPPAEPAAEDLTDGEILEGEGGALALEHPEWLAQARKLRDQLNELLWRAELTREDMRDLQAVYTFVHDLRAKAFADGPGADSLGNFLWRYLTDRGPLTRVKHLLNEGTQA